MSQRPPFAFPSRLYAILDLERVGATHQNPLDVLSAWLDAGVRLLQLRGKQTPDGAMLRLADEAVRRCRAAGATCVINDRADIAVMAGADGVHVGQDDVPPAAVRPIIGPAAVLGVSTHTDEQLEGALQAPVDYVAIGPVFATSTKASANAVVGVDGVRRAAARAHRAGRPIVAIGGITLERAVAVLDAGADAVAIISDLLRGDPRARARQYLQTV